MPGGVLRCDFAVDAVDLLANLGDASMPGAAAAMASFCDRLRPILPKNSLPLP